MNLSTVRYKKNFLLLVAWRFSSVFIVQSSHVPDEYWQSLEVAHKLTFGYGHLTWEWHTGFIRSYLYPFVFSIFYYLLKILGLDFVFFLIYGPRVFHALLTIYADYQFYLWTGSKFALFNLCVNWYWYYCSTRTLINSLETCLTLVALTKFPWKKKSNDVRFLWVVGLLCAARPTALIVWLPILLYHLTNYRCVFGQYIFVGFFFLALSTILDTICYGKFVVTPLNFFKINVIDGISDSFGKMSWYWYFTSGLPVVLGLNYFFFILSICKKTLDKTSLILIFSIIWTLFVYSLLAHKEFRFILPLLPMFLYIIAKNFRTRFKKCVIGSLLLTNLLPGVYFSLLHQRGSLKIMNLLVSDLDNHNSSDVDVLFLTKCHAMPFYSHIHRNLSMTFITCEPNLLNLENYQDETDLVFSDPHSWLKNQSKLPSHVVTYDSVVPTIQNFLNHYNHFGSVWDSFIPKDGFKNFVIYKRKN